VLVCAWEGQREREREKERKRERKRERERERERESTRLVIPSRDPSRHCSGRARERE